MIAIGKHKRRLLAAAIAAPLSLSTIFLTSALAEPVTSADHATRTFDFNIPALPLGQALQQFNTVTGVQYFFSDGNIARIPGNALRGSYSLVQALEALLADTGYAARFTESGSIIVFARNDSGRASDGKASEATHKVRDVRVEEVYVTARKREETVQEIPFAITAFSAEDMRVSGIRNVGDMEGIVPGLNMGGGGNGLKKDSNPFIRGVGQRETKVTLDPAVGTYIDGIYLARTAGALLDTVGMERVEVLRGPQGTLFGKNVAGGAISFTTVKPHENLGGEINVNVGNYGRSDVAAVLNLPITDKLLSRVTLSSKNSDGYFTNVVDNTTWGDDNRVTGIGQLRWLPTDNLMFDVLAERTRIRESPRPSKCAIVREVDKTGTSSPYAPNGTPRPNYNPYYFNPSPIASMDGARTGHGNPDNRKTFAEACQASEELGPDKFASDFSDDNDLLEKGRYWVDTSTLGLTATWDIGQLGPLKETTLKSISSWRKVEQIADEDLDATEYAQLLRIQDGFNETTQVSQEFQFTGSALDDRLFFSTGVFYFKEETPQDMLIRTAGIEQANPQVSPNPGMIQTIALEATRETLETENEAYAWYGQLDFDLTSQIQITAGLRYTYEERWSAYTKGYALGASMVTGEFYPGLNGADFTQTTRPVLEPGLASVWDWVFYSEQYFGRDDNFDLHAPPGYEHAANPYGLAYGRKQDSTRDEAWTPMASIKYHADDTVLESLRLDDAMAYFTYSKGFTSGGVTAGAVDTDRSTGLIRIENPVVFEPQFVDNFELGLKLQAFEGRLQANMAAFYTDYSDMQVTSTANRMGVPIPFVDNVGRAIIQGFEGEFVFMPTANWRIMLNTAYTDADIKEWDSRTVRLHWLYGTPMDEYDVVDRSDEPLPRVPRWQTYLMTDYSFNLPNGGILTSGIAARYTSEIYHGFDRGSYCFTKGGCNISLQTENPVYSEPRPGAENAVTSKEVVFVDARLSYLSADEKMEISFWVKNLMDKRDYMVGAIPLVDTTGTVGQVYADPRTFGLEMSYRFGGG